MSAAALFREAATALVDAHVRALRDTLTFEGALALPEVNPQDVEVAGKEVLLATYRQTNVPVPDQVLVTVQVARHALGGVLSFHLERGLVFTREQPPRDATEQELRESGG